MQDCYDNDSGDACRCQVFRLVLMERNICILDVFHVINAWDAPSDKVGPSLGKIHG